MTPGSRGWIVFALAVVGILAAARIVRAGPDGHTHQGATGRFYQNWKMPDAPWTSCCHDQDCAPAASKFENGQWFARWKDSDEWAPIPPEKIERERETPDGRSHMCARWQLGSLTVFCFIRGGGV